MTPRGVEIFVALDPIDLRWGFDRLCGVVTERLGRAARSGALFVFFGRRRAARSWSWIAPVFACSTSGSYAGTFRVPEPALDGDVARIVDERAFDDLIDGIDIEPRSPRRRARSAGINRQKGRMKEPHVEGLATHDGPESCGGAGNGDVEAFDRGMQGARYRAARSTLPGRRRCPE